MKARTARWQGAARAVAVSVAGLLLTLIAFAFGASSLLVPGIAFMLVGLLAPAIVWLPARAAHIARVAPDIDVVEGERFTGTVTIHTGPLGLIGAELHDPLTDQGVQLLVAPSLAGRQIQLDVTTTFARRGRKRLLPPELRLTDPLGLYRATRQGSEAVELIVLPRTEPGRWRMRSGGGARLALEHGTGGDAYASSEIDGLRPYRPGTPASRIHWAALARGAGLLERRMRAEHESRPLIVIDARSSVEQTELLDRAVRAAASLVLELARAGGCGLLTPESVHPLEVDVRLTAWPAARQRLAVLEPVQRPPVFATRRRPGPVFYVAALPMTRAPQFLLESGGVLVLPDGVAGPGRAPIVFEVAGCLGYNLSAHPQSSRRSTQAVAG